MAAASSRQRIFFIAFLFILGTESIAERTYTNEYAVHIPLGKAFADELAKRHGFTNRGQIGDLDNLFHFEHSGITKRSTGPSNLHAKLAEENGVEWIEQQHLKTRVKREFDIDSFSDPLWHEQWYLNGDVAMSMNVDRAWELGFTGDGVVVSILDDGIEGTHPDLYNNYDPRASYDVNDQDDDPTPRYDLFNTNRHGTRCAGEVAMEAGNHMCGVGVAFNASIGGIRMLDGPITDLVEAISLSIKKRYIDIYSSSWGPEDNGSTVEGPGYLAREAFKTGITKGRHGLGSIFVWASGNGGRMKDSCSCDGYANSIYTISISSVKENSKVPYYLEECASTLASTYSSGSRKSKKIVTSDLNGGCSRHFSGTSASAPLAAGICALTLEANPGLTWRDMQYIIAMTAKRGNLDGSWVVNGAGFHVSHRYGFGLMDAEAMVLLAMEWDTLPKQNTCPVIGSTSRRVFYGGSTLSLDVESDGCEGRSNFVQYLEHVQLNITLAAKSRGDVSIVLISPSGTRSTLLPTRTHDRRRGIFDQWIFMSTHFWGESPEGIWTLEVSSVSPPNYRGTVRGWSLILRGTAVPPLSPSNGPSVNDHEIVKRAEDDYEYGDYFESNSDSELISCHPECRDGCTGEAADQCFRCLHYIDRDTRDCVRNCPEGYYPPPTTNHRCRRCNDACKTCRGHEKTECTSCHNGYVLTEKSECSKDQTCQEGYYQAGSVCRPCAPSCVRCQSEDVCEECDWDKYLRRGKCVNRCEDDEYVDINSSPGSECKPCDASCQTCFTAGDLACLVCVSGKYFNYEGKCEGTKCGDGYFQDEDDTCAECLYGCKVCEDGDTCDTCDDGFVFSPATSECVFFCEEGYYSDGIQCQECPQGCTICILIEGDPGPICLDCDQDYYLTKNGDDCLPCSEDPDMCNVCHPMCNDCWGPGISQCFECIEGHFLLDTTCVPFCPHLGYYQEDDPGLCVPCHDSCLSCSGPEETDCISCHNEDDPVDGACSSQEADCAEGCSECFEDANEICTACMEGYFLQFSTCVQSCQEGYFGEDGDCRPCISTCRTCESSETCTECIDHYVLKENICYTSCGEGFYQDGSQCQPCEDSCQLCGERDDCHLCVEDFYLKGGACVQDCGSGYTPVNEDCWSCHPSCRECDGPNSDDCTQCDDDDDKPVQGVCPQTCGYGQYSDAENECKNCHSGCLTCTGPSESECESCDFYFFLTEEKTCNTTCPTGFYEDFERNICVACHKSCETCIDSGPKNCIQCSEEYYLLLSVEQTCVLNCPEGFYESEDEGFKDCRVCSHNCRGCTNSYLQCTSCEDGKFLYENRCIDKCPEGFTQENQRCVFQECPTNCLNCNEWGDCTNCADGFEEFFGECIKYDQPCEENEYRWYDGINYEPQCLPCNTSCASCVGGGPYDCLECAPNMRMFPDGRCMTACDEGYWFDEVNQLCLECHPSCATCDGISAHDCTFCHKSQQLSKPSHTSTSGSCVAGCPPHKFLENEECQECDGSCAFCFGPGEDQCTACEDGLYLYNKSCISICPTEEGFYHWHPAGSRDGFQCRPCHKSCVSCFDDNESSCTSCKNGTVRQQHSCQLQCDEGYYPDGQICQPCHHNCLACSGSSDRDCTACRDKKVLLEQKCLAACPAHYYSTTMYHEHKVCEPCHQECFNCSGSSVFECTGCYPGYELDDHICFSRCPRGNYFNPNDTSETCLACHDACGDCFGPGANQCISCTPHEVLQRINTNEARCTVCCDGDLKNDCCDCDKINGEMRCPGYVQPQHLRKRKNLASPLGPVVFFCMLIVIAFLVVFGLLQARSNRQLCWRDAYSRLPTYYDPNSQFVKIQADPELDLEEEGDGGGGDYFSEDDVYGEMTDDEEEDY